MFLPTRFSLLRGGNCFTRFRTTFSAELKEFNSLISKLKTNNTMYSYISNRLRRRNRRYCLALFRFSTTGFLQNNVLPVTFLNLKIVCFHILAPISGWGDVLASAVFNFLLFLCWDVELSASGSSWNSSGGGGGLGPKYSSRFSRKFWCWFSSFGRRSFSSKILTRGLFFPPVLSAVFLTFLEPSAVFGGFLARRSVYPTTICEEIIWPHVVVPGHEHHHGCIPNINDLPEELVTMNFLIPMSNLMRLELWIPRSVEPDDKPLRAFPALHPSTW